MKHPTQIKKYQGDLIELAEDIGNLRYDALENFLALLANKISKDGEADFNRNRPKLASKLYHAAESISQSAHDINEAWEVSKPHLKDPVT